MSFLRESGALLDSKRLCDYEFLRTLRNKLPFPPEYSVQFDLNYVRLRIKIDLTSEIIIIDDNF